MTLRKSFWKVNGFPNQDHPDWNKFLDTYAPETEFLEVPKDERVNERMHFAWHDYVEERYPDVNKQDARLLHERDVKYSGDLTFRDLPEGGVATPDVLAACKEFRDACKWWVSGERSTNVVVADAEDFKDVAKNWTLKAENTEEANALNREVELSCQFAEAIVQTVEHTQKGVLGLDQARTSRQEFFTQKLDHVFAIFDR